LITGDIELGDDEKVLNVTRNIASGRGAVFLSSNGGNLIAGINIGMEIKKKDWSTAVYSGWECASACGLIWLAGSPRAVQYGAKIGFHAAYNARTRVPTPEANAFIGGYLRDLGFGFDAVRYITQTPPDQMEWLTAEKARKYNIDVEFLRK
jgi:hypothetical protein